MSAARVLKEAQAAGVTLWAEGDALRYRGPREAVVKLLPALRAHKPEVIAALSRPDPPGISGELVDLEDIPPEAAAHLINVMLIRELVASLKKNGPAILAELAYLEPPAVTHALGAACEGVGITPAQFRALLSEEDLADIAAGDIDSEALRGYALSFAEGIGSGRIAVPGGAA